MLQLPPLPLTVPILSKGEDIARLPPMPTACITCRGKGSFRWLDEANEPADWECSCEDQLKLYRWLQHSGIGLMYQRLRWRDGHGIDQAVLELVSDYVSNCEAYVSAGLGLVLWGKPGTGKTMISTLLMKQILEQGLDGHFATFAEVLDRFTAGWDKDTSKTWFDRRIRSAGVLVIDDIGKEHPGRNTVAITALDHVLRERVANDRPTIITSNMAMSEIGMVYSGNALSLLSECCQVQEFSGTDFRPAHQARKIHESLAGLVRPITLS